MRKANFEKDGVLFGGFPQMLLFGFRQTKLHVT
jgi:hypothetical protein